MKLAGPSADARWRVFPFSIGPYVGQAQFRFYSGMRWSGPCLLRACVRRAPARDHHGPLLTSVPSGAVW